MALTANPALKIVNNVDRNILVMLVKQNFIGIKILAHAKLVKFKIVNFVIIRKCVLFAMIDSIWVKRDAYIVEIIA